MRPEEFVDEFRKALASDDRQTRGDLVRFPVQRDVRIPPSCGGRTDAKNGRALAKYRVRQKRASPQGNEKLRQIPGPAKKTVFSVNDGPRSGRSQAGNREVETEKGKETQRVENTA